LIEERRKEEHLKEESEITLLEKVKWARCFFADELFDVGLKFVNMSRVMN